MDREQVSSRTVMTESTKITSIIEAKDNRDVATCDILNTFIRTEVENKTRMDMKQSGRSESHWLRSSLKSILTTDFCF